jgi:hypothetical protein
MKTRFHLNTIEVLIFVQTVLYLLSQGFLNLFTPVVGLPTWWHINAKAIKALEKSGAWMLRGTHDSNQHLLWTQCREMEEIGAWRRWETYIPRSNLKQLNGNHESVWGTRDTIYVNEDQFTQSFSPPFPVFSFKLHTNLLESHTQKQHMTYSLYL